MKYKILENPVLGSNLPKNRPIRVVGAGIAGLLAGFYLKKAGYEFEIYEQKKIAGGLLGSQTMKYGLAEKAANGFIWCKELQEVADQVGLKILSPNQKAKKRYVVRNQQLKQFPFTIGECLRMSASFFLPHSAQLVTAADFGNIYFDKVFTRQLLGPGLSGIYAADPKELSFPGALTRVAKIMNHSSLFPLALIKNTISNKGKNNSSSKKKGAGTHSFEQGMGALITNLAEYLQSHIKYEVDGKSLKNSTGNLLITVPAHQAIDFFTGKIQSLLSEVKYLPMISTTLFFNKEDLPGFREGFGCLIPPSEGMTVLGILFNSCIFPSRVVDANTLSLTCIIRDQSTDQQWINASEQTIVKQIKKDLKSLFDLQGDPLESVVFKWPKAIPVYSPQLYESWFEMDGILRKEFPNRHLFGNYTGEISVRGMSQAAAKFIT